MEVKIIRTTPRPMEAISQAAGICYGKDNYSKKRVETCAKNGHLSVFEHAYVSFIASGISRACSHQLVRHRMASYCQQSQRYCKYDLSGDDWYVIPPSIKPEHVGSFRNAMYSASVAYKSALQAGYKAEDARYMLPEATKTWIFVTMNVRELFHFFDLRADSHAQWEIRNLAVLLIEELENAFDSQWYEIVEIYRVLQDRKDGKINS